jgi:hypothetical protein
VYRQGLDLTYEKNEAKRKEEEKLKKEEEKRQKEEKKRKKQEEKRKKEEKKVLCFLFHSTDVLCAQWH